MRAIAAAMTMALAMPGLALACAVPTRIEVRNETPQPVRRIWITEASPVPSPSPRGNLLTSDGLPPGASVTLNMPSCLGTYVLTAIFADGTEQRHPDLDARRIRGLALR